MTNDSLINNQGKKVLLYRGYTENGDLSSVQYLPGTKFQVGINNHTPIVANTALSNPIPITNGTINDSGDNTLTGSSGGDNSTDNTTTFKPGGGVNDNTAQNLIANGTATTKIWTIADLTSLGVNIVGTQPFGHWIYILDATALAKFVSIEIKLGSDSSNYSSKTVLVADLITGWNWLNSNITNVEDLSETGTVAGDIDTFIIEITTNNATDTFASGDVIYDLLRQWATTDLTKSFVTSFPTIDLTNLEVTTRCLVSTVDANGFLLDGLAIYNEDASPLMLSEDTFNDESKADSDEFAFITVDRLI